MRSGLQFYSTLSDICLGIQRIDNWQWMIFFTSHVLI